MLRYKDLENQIGQQYPRPVLHCPLCGFDVSGNAGDYFQANPSTVIRCRCGEPMVLATKRIVYDVVKQ